MFDLYVACIPNFDLARCLGTHLKVSCGGGGGWWWLKGILGFRFGPNLRFETEDLDQAEQ